MSTAARKRPSRQAKTRAAGHTEDDLPPPSSFDDAPSGARRSKRLAHVEVEDIKDFEAPRARRRRRTKETTRITKKVKTMTQNKIKTKTMAKTAPPLGLWLYRWHRE
ncbi:hypothetical protein ColLi_13854 [Colletotrichum liriopes]|uniref:Uncharacterized protein n=1 Tax=Colletotrichum liriopes TaxID=708192 RepID=A0AA37M116_9PEZI|nr:hypothetical protein ColLi_13854 [Colletotrichum liriopes]